MKESQGRSMVKRFLSVFSVKGIAILKIDSNKMAWNYYSFKVTI
jgi:hypothetical protein